MASTQEKRLLTEQELVGVPKHEHESFPCGACFAQRFLQDKKSYAAGVADTEEKYKAMLVELFTEIEAYNAGRAASERRLYDWLIQHERTPLWEPLMTEALRQVKP